MRYFLIMIAISLFLSGLFAKEASLSRAQMLLKGKHLSKRYTAVKNRQEAWQQRKIELMDDFEKKYSTDNDFGAENRYGKERQKERKNRFYASLETRESQIDKELLLLTEALETLNEKFSNRFGVGLSRQEMYGGKPPKVKDKKRKISLLQRYIKSEKSWKICLQKVDKFDDSRLALEQRTNIREKLYSSLSMKLDKKVEKNFEKLARYEEDFRAAIDVYALDYGYYIPDVVAAKVLLKNIQKSR